MYTLVQCVQVLYLCACDVYISCSVGVHRCNVGVCIGVDIRCSAICPGVCVCRAEDAMPTWCPHSITLQR